MNENDNIAGYKLVKANSTIFRVPKNIVDIKQSLTVCPKCHMKLEQGNTLVPVDELTDVDIPGMWCRKCDKLYVKKCSFIRELIKDNPRAYGYTYNGKAFWNFTDEHIRLEREKEKLRKLAEVPSAEVMICVRFDDNSNKEIIIASDRQDTNNRKALYYADEIGREFLSAAYARQRDRRGEINGKKFSVIDCVYQKSKRKHLSDHIITKSLTIRKDGGYRDSLKYNGMEIVNTLLYSPYTNRYEIIRSTLDKLNDICFVDIQLYREYVEKYGRPDCSLTLGKQRTGGVICFEDLNPESILMECGYSVSEKNAISTRARQELLADIVDLQILSVSSVVSHIDWCIHSHPGAMYANARYKWKNDMKFIQEYRVNPKRFLIVNKVTRN